MEPVKCPPGDETKVDLSDFGDELLSDIEEVRIDVCRCGNEFVKKNRRHKYCSHNCHPSRDPEYRRNKRAEAAKLKGRNVEHHNDGGQDDLLEGFVKCAGCGLMFKPKEEGQIYHDDLCRWKNEPGTEYKSKDALEERRDGFKQCVCGVWFRPAVAGQKYHSTECWPSKDESNMRERNRKYRRKMGAKPTTHSRKGT